MADALPPIKYARSGDVEIAYTVVGSGPVDLVLVLGWLTNLEVLWEEQNFRRFVQRLTGSGRRPRQSNLQGGGVTWSGSTGVTKSSC